MLRDHVIPAKAGIQDHELRAGRPWIPAYAGMTMWAAFALLLLAAAAPACASDDLLTTPGAAASAVKEIAAKIGGSPQVSLIEITPDEVVMQVQGKKEFHVDEWRWTMVEFWYFEKSFVSGPNPVRPHTPVDDIAASFFPLSSIALDKVPDVVAAAIKRAALEDPGTVDRIRIERQVSIFPKAQYGDPRWMVYVDSGRENATVFAAADGAITGADLSGTQRARDFNMLTDDKYLDQAKTELAAVLADARVREVSFSKLGVSVRTAHPEKNDYAIRYSWNLNGVARDPIDSLDSKMSDEETDIEFKFSDVDFTVLPGLKKAALDALKLEGGAIAEMDAQRLVTGVRAPQLSWTVDIEDAKGERGQVIADARGAILEVIQPESKRPKLDWLAGSTVRATLDRIFAKFPAGTKFRTILINDERGSVDVEDPLKPGELASFVVDDATIEPFGTAFPDQFLDMGAGPPQRFTAEQMAGYDAATVDTLKQRALERLGLKDGKVVRLTFELGNVFVASPRGNVLLEIRADKPDGQSGGRVTYEPDGTELDVVLP